MENSSSELKAGIMIVVSILLGAVLIIFAGDYQSIFMSKQHLKIIFTSVKGLEVSHPVFVSGVEVGKVGGVDIINAEDDPLGEDLPRIEVTAVLPRDILITEDSVVIVDKTLTGVKQLEIERGTGPKLEEGQILIGNDLSGMSAITSKGAGIAEQLEIFVTALNEEELLGGLKASLESVPDTLNSIEELADEVKVVIAANKRNIATMIANLRIVSENLKATSEEVRRKPWILLNKPSKKEMEQMKIHNTARDLSDSLMALNSSIDGVILILEYPDPRIVSATGDFESLLEQMNDALMDLQRVNKQIQQELETK